MNHQNRIVEIEQNPLSEGPSEALTGDKEGPGVGPTGIGQMSETGAGVPTGRVAGGKSGLELPRPDPDTKPRNA